MNQLDFYSDNNDDFFLDSADTNNNNNDIFGDVLFRTEFDDELSGMGNEIGSDLFLTFSLHSSKSTRQNPTTTSDFYNIDKTNEFDTLLATNPTATIQSSGIEAIIDPFNYHRIYLYIAAHDINGLTTYLQYFNQPQHSSFSKQHKRGTVHHYDISEITVPLEDINKYLLTVYKAQKLSIINNNDGNQTTAQEFINNFPIAPHNFRNIAITPLFFAAMLGYIEIIDILLTFGKNCNINHFTVDRLNILFICIIFQQYNLFNMLLLKYGGDSPNVTNSQNNSPNFGNIMATSQNNTNNITLNPTTALNSVFRTSGRNIIFSLMEAYIQYSTPACLYPLLLVNVKHILNMKEVQKNNNDSALFNLEYILQNYNKTNGQHNTPVDSMHLESVISPNNVISFPLHYVTSITALSLDLYSTGQNNANTKQLDLSTNTPTASTLNGVVMIQTPISSKNGSKLSTTHNSNPSLFTPIRPSVFTPRTPQQQKPQTQQTQAQLALALSYEQQQYASIILSLMTSLTTTSSMLSLEYQDLDGNNVIDVILGVINSISNQLNELIALRADNNTSYDLSALLSELYGDNSLVVPQFTPKVPVDPKKLTNTSPGEATTIEQQQQQAPLQLSDVIQHYENAFIQLQYHILFSQHPNGELLLALYTNKSVKYIESTILSQQTKHSHLFNNHLYPHGSILLTCLSFKRYDFFLYLTLNHKEKLFAAVAYCGEYSRNAHFSLLKLTNINHSDFHNNTNTTVTVDGLSPQQLHSRVSPAQSTSSTTQSTTPKKSYLYDPELISAHFCPKPMYNKSIEIHLTDEFLNGSITYDIFVKLMISLFLIKPISNGLLNGALLGNTPNNNTKNTGAFALRNVNNANINMAHNCILNHPQQRENIMNDDAISENDSPFAKNTAVFVESMHGNTNNHPTVSTLPSSVVTNTVTAEMLLFYLIEDDMRDYAIIKSFKSFFDWFHAAKQDVATSNNNNLIYNHITINNNIVFDPTTQNVFPGLFNIHSYKQYISYINNRSHKRNSIIKLIFSSYLDCIKNNQINAFNNALLNQSIGGNTSLLFYKLGKLEQHIQHVNYAITLNNGGFHKRQKLMTERNSPPNSPILDNNNNDDNDNSPRKRKVTPNNQQLVTTLQKQPIVVPASSTTLIVPNPQENMIKTFSAYALLNAFDSLLGISAFDWFHQNLSSPSVYSSLLDIYSNSPTQVQHLNHNNNNNAISNNQQILFKSLMNNQFGEHFIARTVISYDHTKYLMCNGVQSLLGGGNVHHNIVNNCNYNNNPTHNHTPQLSGSGENMWASGSRLQTNNGMTTNNASTNSNEYNTLVFNTYLENKLVYFRRIRSFLDTISPHHQQQRQQQLPLYTADENQVTQQQVISPVYYLWLLQILIPNASLPFLNFHSPEHTAIREEKSSISTSITTNFFTSTRPNCCSLDYNLRFRGVSPQLLNSLSQTIPHAMQHRGKSNNTRGGNIEIPSNSPMSTNNIIKTSLIENSLNRTKTCIGSVLSPPATQNNHQNHHFNHPSHNTTVTTNNDVIQNVLNQIQFKLTHKLGNKSFLHHLVDLYSPAPHLLLKQQNTNTSVSNLEAIIYLFAHSPTPAPCPSISTTPPPFGLYDAHSTAKNNNLSLIEQYKLAQTTTPLQLNPAFHLAPCGSHLAQSVSHIIKQYIAAKSTGFLGHAFHPFSLSKTSQLPIDTTVSMWLNSYFYVDNGFPDNNNNNDVFNTTHEITASPGFNRLNDITASPLRSKPQQHYQQHQSQKVTASAEPRDYLPVFFHLVIPLFPQQQQNSSIGNNVLHSIIPFSPTTITPWQFESVLFCGANPLLVSSVTRKTLLSYLLSPTLLSQVITPPPSSNIHALPEDDATTILFPLHIKTLLQQPPTSKRTPRDRFGYLHAIVRIILRSYPINPQLLNEMRLSSTQTFSFDQVLEMTRDIKHYYNTPIDYPLYNIQSDYVQNPYCDVLSGFFNVTQLMLTQSHIICRATSQSEPQQNGMGIMCSMSSSLANFSLPRYLYETFQSIFPMGFYHVDSIMFETPQHQNLLYQKNNSMGHKTKNKNDMVLYTPLLNKANPRMASITKLFVTYYLQHIRSECQRRRIASLNQRSYSSVYADDLQPQLDILRNEIRSSNRNIYNESLFTIANRHLQLPPLILFCMGKETDKQLQLFEFLISHYIIQQPQKKLQKSDNILSKMCEDEHENNEEDNDETVVDKFDNSPINIVKYLHNLQIPTVSFAISYNKSISNRANQNYLRAIAQYAIDQFSTDPHELFPQKLIAYPLTNLESKSSKQSSIDFNFVVKTDPIIKIIMEQFETPLSLLLLSPGNDKCIQILLEAGMMDTLQQYHIDRSLINYRHYFTTHNNNKPFTKKSNNNDQKSNEHRNSDNDDVDACGTTNSIETLQSPPLEINIKEAAQYQTPPTGFINTPKQKSTSTHKKQHQNYAVPKTQVTSTGPIPSTSSPAMSDNQDRDLEIVDEQPTKANKDLIISLLNQSTGSNGINNNTINNTGNDVFNTSTASTLLPPKSHQQTSAYSQPNHYPPQPQYQQPASPSLSRNNSQNVSLRRNMSVITPFMQRIQSKNNTNTSESPLTLTTPAPEGITKKAQASPLVYNSMPASPISASPLIDNVASTAPDAANTPHTHSSAEKNSSSVKKTFSLYNTVKRTSTQSKK